MSKNYRNEQQVSKPLLMVLILVVVIGAAYFAFTAMNSGGEEKVEGVPEVPTEAQAPVPKEVKDQFPTVEYK